MILLLLQRTCECENRERRIVRMQERMRVRLRLEIDTSASTVEPHAQFKIWGVGQGREKEACTVTTYCVREVQPAALQTAELNCELDVL